MPNETVKKYAEKKNALERLDILEASLVGVIQSANSSLGKLEQNFNQRLAEADQRLMNLAELIDAVTTVAGVEKVQVELKTIKDRNYESRVKAEQALIDEALLTGKLTPSTEIKENSLLVLEEFRDGKTVQYPRAQFPISNLIPSARKDLLGKGVGAVTEVKEGNGFKVVEVYDINPDAPVEEKTPEPPAPEAPKTNEGPQFKTPPSELNPPGLVQGPSPEAN